jgi:hypothetical protein
MAVHRLDRDPIHLGLGARAEAQPPFTGMEWYADYARRHKGDGVEGRLVSMYRFTESWDSWEMHPSGDEVVLCLSGRMVLHQELADGSRETVALAEANMPSIRRAPGIPPMSRARRRHCSSPPGRAQSIAHAEQT